MKAVLEQLSVLAEKIASSRYPIPTVHTIINARYSPLNRLVYSRLSPNHMDTMNNLLRMYGASTDVSAGGMHSYLPSAAYRGLTESEIDHMILHSPITDQLYLSKYLFSVTPAAWAVDILKSLVGTSSDSSTSATTVAGSSKVAKNRVDSQRVTVTPASTKSLSPPPVQSNSMERDSDTEVLTSSLQQVDLSLADNARLSPFNKKKNSTAGESEVRNDTTVWKDLTSIFTNILPFKSSNSDNNKTDSEDFEDKI